MSLYILGTDHISLLQYGNENIVLRSASIEPEAIAITVISLEEQLRGRFAKIRETEKRKDRDDWLVAYRNLRVTFESLANFSILDFTTEARDCYLDLQQSVKIGKQDLKIAAIAFTRHAIVVTRNQKDFSRVPSLRFEDWTI